MASNETHNNDLAYADTLWKSADALRGQVDAAEYKHVVLGLLFLKYISDAFEARCVALRGELEADGITGPQLETLLESRDEYTAERVFWVPPEARWRNLQNQAPRPDIATLIDDAILAVERDNPNLKGKLPRDYARRGIAPEKLKGLIDLIADLGFKGDRASAGSTSTSSASSPKPRASSAASSSPRAASCGCWSRCSNPTAAAFTTLAAARPACSCSRNASWRPTAGRRPTSRSSARSRTPPPGGWRT
jgi:hypothetical protein